ncbi:MAG: ribosome small subunit-dependent GTPase A [Lachnospiraceae bacterium]|nr:ribosome small subunit-dependent GTPase A [Lachnospiraceae bacterium]
MKGKIMKGISGFYYVYVAGAGIYECKAKGAFRRQKRKPLVGDDVEIAVIDEETKKGNVEELLPRRMELIRPAVANVDMALVVFAATKPEPNFNLLDRFLCMMEFQNLPVTICFNKCDLVGEEEQRSLASVYETAGYPVIFTSAKQQIHLEELKAALKGKTTTVAGPSGVGKSSLINALQSNVRMETGTISAKIERGKNTTRHSEIIPISEDSFIVDTPGFSSLDVPGMEKEDLWRCYPEFVPFEPYCRFRGCSHISEPDCGVKEALAEGKISQERYRNYVLIYEEMKNIRKY